MAVLIFKWNYNVQAGDDYFGAWEKADFSVEQEFLEKLKAIEYLFSRNTDVYFDFDVKKKKKKIRHMIGIEEEDKVLTKKIAKFVCVTCAISRRVVYMKLAH